MIQRIQTIWLFLIFLLSGCLFFLFPVKSESSDLFPYLCLWIGGIALTFVLSFVAIFLYKKRPLQLKMCTGIWILQILFYVTVFFALRSTRETDVVWQWTVAFPLIVCILDILAIRAIKKDEKLVRSLDRLR